MQGRALHPTSCDICPVHGPCVEFCQRLTSARNVGGLHSFRLWKDKNITDVASVVVGSAPCLTGQLYTIGYKGVDKLAASKTDVPDFLFINLTH